VLKALSRRKRRGPFLKGQERLPEARGPSRWRDMRSPQGERQRALAPARSGGLVSFRPTRERTRAHAARAKSRRARAPQLRLKNKPNPHQALRQGPTVHYIICSKCPAALPFGTVWVHVGLHEQQTKHDHTAEVAAKRLGTSCFSGQS